MKNLVNEEYSMKNWVNLEYKHEEFGQRDEYKRSLEIFINVGHKLEGLRLKVEYKHK